jgi:hypothetical protein
MPEDNVVVFVGETKALRTNRICSKGLVESILPTETFVTWCLGGSNPCNLPALHHVRRSFSEDGSPLGDAGWLILVLFVHFCVNF